MKSLSLIFSSYIISKDLTIVCFNIGLKGKTPNLGSLNHTFKLY